MYNELFNFNGSIDKKPAAQLKQQAFHQIKTQRSSGLSYQPGFCTREGQRFSSSCKIGHKYDLGALNTRLSSTTKRSIRYFFSINLYFSIRIFYRFHPMRLTLIFRIWPFRSFTLEVVL